MDPKKPLCRRRFLALAAGAAATAACSPQAPGASTDAFGDVGAGNVSGIAVGQLRALSGVAAAIGRDAKGLYAMSLVCTHQGCEMTDGVRASGISCRCHGSQFDTNGNVIQGPADRPLQHFRVSVDGVGNITVHGGDYVSLDERTPA